MTADAPFHTRRAAEILARENPAQASHIPALLEMLDAGLPVPFIVRYRKEKTGGMDEEKILEIVQRRRSLDALEDRRSAITEDLKGRGLLSEAVEKKVQKARSLPALEDVARAFSDGHRTPEESAAEEAFGALASAIERGEVALSLADLAAPFVSEEKGATDTDAAVAAARSVIARRMSEEPDARTRLRNHLESSGKFRSKLIPDGDVQKKYVAYHDFAQSAKSIPGHRVLAALRGAREKALEVSLEADRERGLEILKVVFPIAEDHPFREVMEQALETAHDERLVPTLTTEVFDTLKARADQESIRIFAKNLEQLLFLPPAGRQVVIGVEPGKRRGCKIAVIDESGQLQRHATIQPFVDEKKEGADKKREAAKKTVGDFCRHHKASYIGVGSGPGCREVEQFLRAAIAEDDTIEARLVIVNEAGSADYAASDIAKSEFPKLDNRVRAAVSVARRLQDPLAELVKIRPSAIAVGPYQKDVDQKLLDDSLGCIVECCVNRVGVDVNTAETSLLANVAGLTPHHAAAIVAHRTEKGPFATREAVREVEVLDDDRFRVAAGFLRVMDGANALDRTSIHPEVYPLIERMAEKIGVQPGELVGNDRALDGLDPGGFAGDGYDLETVYEVFRELRVGGGDPRGVFEPPTFRDDLKSLSDLEEGMQLEGVVTNIASFGAFVDVGVDQEGLVHVSELSDEFVEDPASVVSVGQRVKVRVIGIDTERKRLSLSRRTPGAKKPRRGGAAPGRAPAGRKPRGRPAARGATGPEPAEQAVAGEPVAPVDRGRTGGGSRSGARRGEPGRGDSDRGGSDRGGPGRGGPGRGGPGRGGPGRGGPGRGGPGRGGPGRGGPGRGGRKPGGRPGGGGGGGGGKGRRGSGDDYVDDTRAPRIIEARAKREPEPEIDKTLPEEEQYRLKLERLRKKFEKGN